MNSTQRQKTAEFAADRSELTEPTPDAADKRLPTNLINWRLAALVVAVRRSADPAYKRLTGLSVFDSRAIRHIGVYAPLLLTELAALMSRDKAQVSRIVKRLVHAGLVERPNSRAALLLTEVGRAVYTRVLDLSRTRNTTLIRRVGGQDLDEFRRLIARIRANAQECLEAQAPQTLDVVRRTVITARLTQTLEAGAHERDSVVRMRLILPNLIQLLDLLNASAESAYSRVSGLTNFEWRLVGLVAQKPTLTLIELVQLLDRDKSQVGRAVQRLTTENILNSEKIGGGRHVLLSLTAKGKLINDRLFRVVKQRNQLLAEGLSIRELQTLVDVFDKLSEGAAELLAEEDGLSQAAS